MTKSKEALEFSLSVYNEKLAALMNEYSHINEDTIFEVSYYHIAKMVPDYFKRNDYIDVAISVSECSIQSLYESHTRDSLNYKYINVTAVTLLSSSIASYVIDIPFALLVAAIIYFYLAKRALRESTDRMHMQEWMLDRINDLKTDIKQLKELKKQ